MTAATEHYLGWLSPSAEGERRFDFAVRTPALGQESWEEFERIVGVFGKVRPHLIDFLAVEAEHAALVRTPADLVAALERRPLPMLEVGGTAIEHHVLADRRLGGFLAAASAFRDRLLRGRPAGDPLCRLLRKLYDRSFGYRLCYNLRNYAQHHASPFWILPVNGQGAEGRLRFEVEIDLDRDRLIATADKFQPAVRAELHAQPERIPLLPAAADYLARLRELFAGFLQQHAEALDEALGYAAAVRRVLTEMPPNATPVLFEGRPQVAAGVESKVRFHSFSFDELALLARVVAQTRRG